MASRWFRIAGDFPPRLNKDSPTTSLKPNETPDGYGFSLILPARLASGTCPTGTAASWEKYTVGGATYTCYFNRLWRLSGATLIYGAPEYSASYFAQDLGIITLPESTTAYAVLPLRGGNLGLLTETGGYVLHNAAAASGDFQLGHLQEEVLISDATYACGYRGLIYLNNDKGIFSWDGNELEEVTYPVRNNITGFTNTALTANYAKGWIIGTSKFVVDIRRSHAIYDFNTSGFLYTSPTVISADFGPFRVEKIAFFIEHGDTSAKSITLQTRYEDQDWGLPETLTWPYEEDRYTRVEWNLFSKLTSHRFAMRITAMDSTLYIKEITGLAEGMRLADYSQ